MQGMVHILRQRECEGERDTVEVAEGKWSFEGLKSANFCSSYICYYNISFDEMCVSLIPIRSVFLLRTFKYSYKINYTVH